MAVFGWIMLIILGLLGLSMLVVFAIPYIITECKMIKEKINRATEDRREDLNRRSEARRNRDTIRRNKDNELAEKKLEAKMLKVNKQIEIQQKKIDLAKELKEQAEAEVANLKKIKEEAAPVEEQSKEEEPVVAIVPEEDHVGETNNIIF